ncbi:MAG: HIT family protein [Erysipelothrix sp.]|nr:HIT family protein [Erysipelothrix sp.]
MCIFCKIINKELDSETVYEDKDVIAIMDLNPLTKGHTLVIPKVHYKNILDTPPEVLKKVMVVAQKLAIQYMDTLKMEGFNLVVNNNSVAQQAVDHLHVHIIPRYNKDEINYLSKAK